LKYVPCIFSEKRRKKGGEKQTHEAEGKKKRMDDCPGVKKSQSLHQIGGHSKKSGVGETLTGGAGRKRLLMRGEPRLKGRGPKMGRARSSTLEKERGGRWLSRYDTVSVEQKRFRTLGRRDKSRKFFFASLAVRGGVACELARHADAWSGGGRTSGLLNTQKRGREEFSRGRE